MIWVVLSLILAVILLLHEGQKSLREAGDFLFTKISDIDFKKLFFAEGAKSLLAPTVQANLSMSAVQVSLKIRGFRANTLRLALSVLALIPFWLWTHLVLSISGSYLAGITAVTFLFLHLFTNEKVQILKGFVRFLFFAAVALVLMEQLMRLGSQVMMVAHEYEWIFMVSIGSFGNGLMLLAMSFVLSFFLRISGWSFVLTLALLLTGVLAFNNAIFLVAGEMLALPWTVYIYLRGFSPFLRKWYVQYSLVHSAAVVVTAIVLIGLRSEIFMQEVGSLGQTEVRHQALLFVFAAFIILPFLAAMGWGHFVSKTAPEEVDGTRVSRLPSLVNMIWSKADLSFLRQSLEKRLSTLEEQQLELKKQEYAGVPAPLLQKHNAEFQTVKQIVNDLRQI